MKKIILFILFAVFAKISFGQLALKVKQDTVNQNLRLIASELKDSLNRNNRALYNRSNTSPTYNQSLTDITELIRLNTLGSGTGLGDLTKLIYDGSNDVTNSRFWIKDVKLSTDTTNQTLRTISSTNSTIKQKLDTVNQNLRVTNTKLASIQLAIDSMNYITSVKKSFSITPTNTASASYTAGMCISTSTTASQQAQTFTLSAGTWKLIGARVYTGGTPLTNGIDIVFYNSAPANQADFTLLVVSGFAETRKIIGQCYGKGAATTSAWWAGSSWAVDCFAGTTQQTVQQSQNFIVFDPITSGTSTFYFYLVSVGAMSKGSNETFIVDLVFQKID